MNQKYPHPHTRLEAYKLSVELAVTGRRMAAAVPRGDRDLAGQLRRSSSAVSLLIAEGASRVAPGNKRLRFSEARGECAETAATVTLLCALGVVDAEQAHEVDQLTGRIAAMLTKLIQRLG